MKKFTLSFNCVVTLDVDSIWPDGDASENPTVEDVYDVIDSCGGPAEIIRDWNLDPYLTLDISEV